MKSVSSVFASLKKNYMFFPRVIFGTNSMFTDDRDHKLVEEKNLYLLTVIFMYAITLTMYNVSNAA